MTYKSTELAELTGLDITKISTYLRNGGFFPIDVAENNQNVWEEECLDFLMKKKHSMNIKDTILLTSLSATFNMSCDVLRNILKNKGIEPVEVTANNITGNKIERYPLEVKKILIEHFDSLKVDKSDDHPLVTDPRCLRLNWWPETMPKCFEDLDEAII